MQPTEWKATAEPVSREDLGIQTQENVWGDEGEPRFPLPRKETVSGNLENCKKFFAVVEKNSTRSQKRAPASFPLPSHTQRWGVDTCWFTCHCSPPLSSPPTLSVLAHPWNSGNRNLPSTFLSNIERGLQTVVA